jgi:hypothetical protein
VVFDIADDTVAGSLHVYAVFYDNMNIIGVVDDRIIGTNYSVWPLSQAHIIDLDAPSAIDNIESNARIYSVDKNIYVETREGANISVFTLHGQCLYSAETIGNITQISNIFEKCVIILVDKEAYKISVR